MLLFTPIAFTGNYPAYPFYSSVKYVNTNGRYFVSSLKILPARAGASNNSVKGFLCAIFLFCAATLCMGQPDSLQKKLGTASGKEKIRLLNKLTVADTAQYKSYHQEALLLAKELNDRAGEVMAYCAMGDHYYNVYQPDSAYTWFTRALKLARTYKLEHEQVVALQKSAAASTDLGRYDEALSFYTEALAISRKNNDKKDLVKTLECLGIFYYDQRDYTKALEYFREELPIAEQAKDSSSLSACFNNIGLVYSARGDYANSIINYKRVRAIEENLQNEFAVGQSLINIGIVYKDLGAYDLALQSLLEAARYFEKGPPTMELASCYNTIGNVHFELKDVDKALEYHRKSLVIRQNIHYKKGIAIALTNIGSDYMLLGEYDSALIYLNRSLALKEEIGDKKLIAFTLDPLGKVHFLQHDFDKAKNYYQRSLALKQEIEDAKGMATTLNNLGALYLEWQKYDSAIVRLDEGRSIAERIGAKQVLLDNYELTIKAFHATGDSARAIPYYDRLLLLKDELLDEQKNEALTEMQVKYETEKKENEILLLNEKDKASAAILSRQNLAIYSLIGGAVLLVVAVLALLKAYRSGRKAYLQSQVIISQKQVMMRELHHRVKNNLQVLSSLLNLQQIRIQETSTKEAVRDVEHRLNAMLLIHQDLYGDNDGSQVNMREYLGKLADNLLDSFGHSAGNVRIRLDVDDLPLDADKALNVGFICNEIITNALKHAFAGIAEPELSIRMTSTEDMIHLVISDNGNGMPGEAAFEKTNSFGLRLIHLFLRDLQGTINIVPGKKGAGFELLIPQTHQVA